VPVERVVLALHRSTLARVPRGGEQRVGAVRSKAVRLGEGLVSGSLSHRGGPAGLPVWPDL